MIGINHINSQRDARRGFSFLGILIVLVIIFVLAGYYFSGDDEGAGVDDYLKRSQQAAGTYQMVKNRTQNVVGDQNLQVFQNQVNMWVMHHPGQKPTIEALQKDPSFNVPVPPDGFRYEIDESNNVVLVQSQPTNIPAPH